MPESVIPDGQGRVQILYSRGGHPMESNLHVRLALVGSAYLITNVASTLQQDLADWWDDFDDAWWLPLLPTTTTVNTVNLWRYDQGAYYFVEGITPSAVGTGTETPDPCTMLNITLRDHNWVFGHVTITEPAFATSVASKKHGETWQDLLDFIAALTAGSDSGVGIGSTIVSKPGGFFRANPNWTIKVSDRIRRIRGYI